PGGRGGRGRRTTLRTRDPADVRRRARSFAHSAEALHEGSEIPATRVEVRHGSDVEKIVDAPLALDHYRFHPDRGAVEASPHHRTLGGPSIDGEGAAVLDDPILQPEGQV